MSTSRPLRIGISGFGRIGRLALRAFYEHNIKDMEVVGVNDWKDLDKSAHLLQYDSVHGQFGINIVKQKEGLNLGRGTIQALSSRDPKALNWGALGVDLVFECSGKFNKRDAAAQHLEAGAKRVLVSAPCEGADLTVVYGVNHKDISPNHCVVSNASCTTNCLAPVVAVLDKNFGIERGFCTTIHAYTGDQNLVDSSHKDLRRARAAGVSMIPTSTGAARAVSQVLPKLKGRLDGAAIRVPTANVSMIDFCVTLEKSVSTETINTVLREAAESTMKGVLGINDAPLVSCDFNHDPRSSIFDTTQTEVIGGRFARVVAWYDNEWGFACRMFDVARQMATTL